MSLYSIPVPINYQLEQNFITLSGSKLVADMQRAEIWPII